MWPSSILREVLRVLVLAGVGAASGSLAAAPGAGAAVGLALFLGWHVRQWRVVRQWGRFVGAPIPQDLSPVWREWVRELEERRAHAAEVAAELVRLQYKFEALSATLPDAAVEVDGELQIEWFNKAAEVLLDLQEDDLGRSLVSVVRAPVLVEYLDAGDFALPLNLERLADIAHPVSVQVTTFGDQVKLITFRDLTQEIRLNRLRQEFVANVSHEIKSPLTVVAGYLETMEDQPDESPKRSIVREMSRQCQRMRRLVDDLLQLSRLEASELSDKDLQEIRLAGLAAEVKREAEALVSDAKHAIRIDGAEELAVRGSAEELYSALFNLVSNALRYSPDGGVVTIRWARKGDRIRLSVADEGVGIKADQITRLTERFYRVDKARSRDTGGTGLGLAIVKHILQRHGARLQIDSEWGAGSTFTCVFPAPAEWFGGD